MRGWAWTRALLGINADEIHLCGEAAALDVVKSMVMLAGDDIEVCILPLLEQAQGQLTQWTLVYHPSFCCPSSVINFSKYFHINETTSRTKVFVDLLQGQGQRSHVQNTFCAIYPEPLV